MFHRANFEQELIGKYESVVIDYLSIMQASESVKSMDEWKYTVQAGLSIITNIFKLSYLATRNATTSEGYSQKGTYCYIEYIEQMQKLAGTQQQIDYMDAVLFVYEKSLSELYAGGHVSETSSFSNILSVSQSHQSQGDDFEKCKLILDQMTSVASSLVWLNHPTFTLADQIEIVGTHLYEFLYLAADFAGLRANNDIFVFLAAIQTHMDGMTKQEYMEILTALQKNMKRRIKKGNGANANGVNADVLMACLHLKTFPTGKTLGEIADMEKWKRPAEDLVKLAF